MGMNKERLLKWAKGIEEEHDGLGFTLDHWIEYAPTGREEPACMTAACAVGHLPLIFDEWEYEGRKHPGVSRMGIYRVSNPAHRTMVNDVADFFNIPRSDLGLIIFDEEYAFGPVTRQDVAGRIRKMVEVGPQEFRQLVGDQYDA